MSDEKSWEEMSESEKYTEWYAMSDRERAQFRNYRDSRESLKRLRDYIDRELENYDYPTDLICHIADIRCNINEWAGQKWCSAVDEVMETRIDCESVRLAAA